MFKKTKESCICRCCDSTDTVCNGRKYNKQRYLCKSCGRSFSESDTRIKRDPKERELCLLLYSYNMSMRSIQNTLNKFYDTNISFNLVDTWIKSFFKLLSYDLDRNRKGKKPKTVKILELYELHSYFCNIKKNRENRSKYGLLLIEEEIKLLRLK
ncbi:MAG: hypothetical protein LBB13_03440 [Rickettsiales bacterium]|jgi:transposase-like protein|nr:hypothetical protein [Rickettsiales bacterium]